MKNKHLSLLTTILLIILPTLATLTAIKYFDIYYPIRVTQSQAADFVISAEGKVDVIPDTAYVDVGITVSGVPNVQEVQKQLNDANNKIIEQIKNLGIDTKDIKTTNYNIYPQYEVRPEGSTNEIQSYSGNASLVITVRDKDHAPKVVQTATNAGANQISGIRYAVENIDEFRKQARDQAIANAQKQAKDLADKLGIKLGKVINIVESNTPTPFYSQNFAKSAVDAVGFGSGTPTLEPGTQTVTSSVTLYFQKN
jgi:uncharacterized protein YggE